MGTAPWCNGNMLTNETHAEQQPLTDVTVGAWSPQPLPTPSSGQGRTHGTSRNEPFDRWFRYPAGFASDYVTTLLAHLELDSESLVLDPFAGSAVTGTAARQAGHSFFGVEAHPMIAELARLKLQSQPRTKDKTLGEVARTLAVAAAQQSSSAERRIDQEPDLVTRCFSTPVLGQLVALRDMIRAGAGESWNLHAKWALLGTLRDVASARVGWPYQRPGTERKPIHSNPLARFVQRAEWMEQDIREATENPNNLFYQVVQGNSCEKIAWEKLSPESAHGCVSSPPYLNNFDYADATRLELYFWGDISSWAEMCTEVRSDMLTATTQQSSVPAARMATARLAEYGEIADSVLDITSKLLAERNKRPRGKEYDRVLPDYFLAIAQVLENMATALKPGSPVVWLVGDSAPYGVYVDTPRLIGDIAQSLGFSFEKDITLRKRGQRWQSNSVRHDVQLSERLILFRKN